MSDPPRPHASARRAIGWSPAGPAIMPIFDDLQQVTTIFLTERRQAPVIGISKSVLARSSALSHSVHPLGDGQFGEESRETEVERGQTFATGLVPNAQPSHVFPMPVGPVIKTL